MIVVASLEPFAIHLAQRDPARAHAPLVTLDPAERIRGRSHAAARAGIRTGMPLAGARGLAPDLQVIPDRTPEVLTAWHETLRETYDTSPHLTELGLGVLAFRGTHADATSFAHAHRARVGACRELELAHLLAHTAPTGEARTTEDPWSVLASAPAYLLRAAGVSVRTLDRLAWLGIDQLGPLRSWSRAQVDAFFGPDAPTVRTLLWGPHRDRLPPYRLPPSLRTRVELDTPVAEPGPAHELLAALCRHLEERLGDRSAQLVAVSCETSGMRLRATRRAKQGVRSARRILALATLALEDSGALPLGIDALALELGQITRPSTQGALWRQRQRTQRAVREVAARFPDALVRFVEHDPHALESGLRFRRVNLRTGEDLDGIRPLAPDEAPRAPFAAPAGDAHAS